MRSIQFTSRSHFLVVAFAVMYACAAFPSSGFAQSGLNENVSLIRFETQLIGKPLRDVSGVTFTVESEDGLVKLKLGTEQMFNATPGADGVHGPCPGVSEELCIGDVGLRVAGIERFNIGVKDGPSDVVPIFTGDCEPGGRAGEIQIEIQSRKRVICRVTFASYDAAKDIPTAAVHVTKIWDPGRLPGALPGGRLTLRAERDGGESGKIELADLRDGTDWVVGVALTSGGVSPSLTEELSAAGWLGIIGGQCVGDDASDLLVPGGLVNCTVTNVALETSAASPDAVLRIEAKVAGVPLATPASGSFRLLSNDGTTDVTLHAKQMYGTNLEADGRLEWCPGMTVNVCVGDIGVKGISQPSAQVAAFRVVADGPAGSIPVYSGACGAGGRVKIPPLKITVCEVTFVRADTGDPASDAAVQITKHWDIGRSGPLPAGKLTLRAQRDGSVTGTRELKDLRNGTEWMAGVKLGNDTAFATLTEELDAPGWLGFVGGQCAGDDLTDVLAAGVMLICEVTNVAPEVSVKDADGVLRIETAVLGVPRGTEPATFRLVSKDGKTDLTLNTGQMFRLQPLSGDPEVCPGIGPDGCVGDIGVVGVAPQTFEAFTLLVPQKPSGTVPVFSLGCAGGRVDILPRKLTTCRVTFVYTDTGPSDANAAVRVTKLWDGSRPPGALPPGSLTLDAQPNGSRSGEIDLADLHNGEWLAGVKLAEGDAAPVVVGEKMEAPGWTPFVIGGRCNTGQPIDYLLQGMIRECTVLNVAVEEYPKPLASIGNASVAEGNSGTRQVALTVSLDAPPMLPVQIGYSTLNGSATAPADYTALNNSLTILAGQTSGSINATVVGELLGEPNETFRVLLGSMAGARPGVTEGVVTIVNDDDTTPPSIAFKATVIVETKAAPISVPFTNPTATDLLDGAVTVSCLPKSGALFPFGTTQVRCSSTDRNGNVANSSFNVTVRTPTTTGAVTNPGTATALTSVAPGRRVRVSAGGFAPGSTVELRWMDPTGAEIPVAMTTAGADGRFDAVVSVPVNAPAGPGQMTATGVDSSGAEFVRGWLLTVVAQRPSDAGIPLD